MDDVAFDVNVTTISGTGKIGCQDGDLSQAMFSRPSAVTVDRNGDVIICDGNKIRKIRFDTNKVETIAGTDSGYSDGHPTLAKFYQPMGLAVDEYDDIIIADSLNHRIRKLAVKRGKVETIAGSGEPGNEDGIALYAKFFRPTGLVIDRHGDIIIAENWNNRIRKLIMDQDRVVTIAGSSKNSILKATGDPNGKALDAQFRQPISLALDNNGDIIIADFGNNKIKKLIVSEEIVVTLAGGGGGKKSGYKDGAASESLFNGPHGLVVDRNGDIIISDSQNFCLRKLIITHDKYKPEVIMSRIKLLPFVLVKLILAFIADEVVTIAGNGKIGFEDGKALQTKFNVPQGIAMLKNGDIIIADSNNNRIRKIDYSKMIEKLDKQLDLEPSDSNSFELVTEGNDCNTPTEPKDGKNQSLSIATIRRDELEFNESDKLGEGGFAKVYRALWKTQSISVAVKVLKNSTNTVKQKFLEEAQIMFRLNHLPYVVKFYGIVTGTDECMIALEYCERGCLFDILNDYSERIEWRSRWKWCYESATALFHLHENKIVHRDIKSLNFLVTKKNNEIRVSDFGLAEVKTLSSAFASLDTTPSSTNSNKKRPAGSIPWMAPELFSIKSNKQTFATDVYAYGMVLWEIAFRRIPYELVLDEHIIIASVIKGDRLELDYTVEEFGNAEKEKYREGEAKAVPKAFKDLITVCWNQNSNDRPTFSKILEYIRSHMNDNDEITLPEPFVSSSLTTYNTTVAQSTQAIIEKKAPTKPVKQWDSDDVVEWLKFLRLDVVISKFRESLVNGELLLNLKENDLIDPKQFNIENKSQRSRILMEIGKLKSNTNSLPSTQENI